MDPITCIFLLIILFLQPRYPSAEPEPTKPATLTSTIAVAGVVYCDVCSTGTFSRYSYFLPGVDVNIQCKFKANAPKTTEQIEFSVNRTTDRYGVYKLEIPSVDGVDCVEGQQIASSCQATLLSSSYPNCNVPGIRTTASEISIKSKQQNLCIFSLSALSYSPPRKNFTICGHKKEGSSPTQLESPEFLNSSKFFLPYFPPYGLPWAPIPKLPFPPLPPLPPFPSMPFPQLPPLPPFPFPFPRPPSLPFPFPPLPPFPPTPFLTNPPSPSSSAAPGPGTRIPGIPFFASPPPPASTFNPWDPRTWIPYFPPYSPPGPQDHTP